MGRLMPETTSFLRKAVIVGLGGSCSLRITQMDPFLPEVCTSATTYDLTILSLQQSLFLLVFCYGSRQYLYSHLSLLRLFTSTIPANYEIGHGIRKPAPQLAQPRRVHDQAASSRSSCVAFKRK